MKGSGNSSGLTGKEGRRQYYFDNVNMLRMVFGGSNRVVHFKLKPVDVSFVFFIGEIKFSASVFEHLVGECGLIVFIGIGPKVKPDEGECIGRIVGVLHLRKAIEGMFFVIECNVDGVVDFLLPIDCLRVGSGE